MFKHFKVKILEFPMILNNCNIIDKTSLMKAATKSEIKVFLL